jgi:hypothetical protein
MDMENTRATKRRRTSFAISSPDKAIDEAAYDSRHIGAAAEQEPVERVTSKGRKQRQVRQVQPIPPIAVVHAYQTVSCGISPFLFFHFLHSIPSCTLLRVAM